MGTLSTIYSKLKFAAVFEVASTNIVELYKKRKRQQTNKQPNNNANATGKSRMKPRRKKTVRRVSKELANSVIKIKLS